MKVFTTLLAKEVREHLHWALLMALVMLAAMAYSLLTVGQEQSSRSPVLGSTFSLVAGFGFPLIAAGLGLLITLFEARGDRWAFLVHRPISPTLLFWGKAAGGLVLYALASLLPWLLIVSWLSWPDNLPFPFLWPMVLPGLASLLIGAVYLPVAMLVGLRDARWYASRALPLGLGIVVSSIAGETFEFHQGALIALAAFLIALLAARHVFITRAGQNTDALPLRALSHTTLFLTFLPGIWCIFYVLVFILTMLLPYEKYENVYDRFHILKDGRLILVSTNATKLTFTVTNPDLKPIPDLPQGPTPSQQFDAIEELMAPTTTLSRSQSWEMNQSQRGENAPYHHFQRYAVRLPFYGLSYNRSQWFYMIDTKVITGIATDRYAGRALSTIGSFGPDAFSPAGQPLPAPFTDGILDIVNSSGRNSDETIVSPHGVTRFDPIKYTISPRTFNLASGETIHLHGPEPRAPKDTRYASSQDAILVTSSRILFFDEHNALTKQIPLPQGVFFTPPYFDRNSFHFFSTPGKYHLLYSNYTPRVRTNPLPPITYTLFTFDHALSAWSQPAKLSVAQRDYGSQDPVKSALRGIPTGPAGLAVFISNIYMQRPSHSDYQYNYLSDFLEAYGLWVALSSILGLLTTLTLGLSRKLPITPLITWAFAGALAGPASALVMLALLPSEPSLKCQACGKPRKADKPLCPACQAPFPPPAPNGTEVFAPLA